MASEAFLIHGRLTGPSFNQWLMRHAARLGLNAQIQHSGTDLLRATISGPADLLDAMEMGCLLGPIQVWVDHIDRQAVNSPAASGGSGAERLSQ